MKDKRESEYTMYHKNIPTITFIRDSKGYIEEITGVHNIRHVHPFFFEDGDLPSDDNYYHLCDKLLRWMEERNIPSSRKNLSSALSRLGVRDARELAEKNFYLSLTDHYWIAPSSLNLDWNRVNFFSNDFSEDVGKALFGNMTKKKSINLRSPDSNTQGRLVKKWIIDGGQRCLIKGGSGTEQIEPFNEVLASEICSRLGMAHVNYELYIEDRKHYCRCGDFVDEKTEMITAAELCEDVLGRIDGFVTCEKFADRCGKWGINLNPMEIGKMFLVDYLIANEDRHLNNFGFIRDADTLEWKGMAPVFDSGTSMFYNLNDFEMDGSIGCSDRLVPCKPFSASHLGQLSIFGMRNVMEGMDLGSLDGIGDFYGELLSKNQRNIPVSKIDMLCRVLDTRVGILKTVQRGNFESLDVVKDFRARTSGGNGRGNAQSVINDIREGDVYDSVSLELFDCYLSGNYVASAARQRNMDMSDKTVSPRGDEPKNRRDAQCSQWDYRTSPTACKEKKNVRTKSDDGGMGR